MKNLKSTLIVLALSVAIKINAQTHSTISGLGVSYKPAATANGGANLSDLKCSPQATVALKSNSGASKIYIKILNAEDSSVVFQTNYSFSASPVVINGVKLFEKAGDTVYINCEQLLTLKPYIYQIQTADSQNNLTEVYSDTK